MIKLLKKANNIWILIITVLIMFSSCKPANTSPPAYLKNIVVYREGYDAVAVYFILADSSGTMTAANGSITIDISLKRNLPRKKMEAGSFNDDLMDKILAKEAEWEDLAGKYATVTFNAISYTVNKNLYREDLDQLSEAAAKKAGSKYEKQMVEVKESLGDLQKKLINKYKVTKTQVPKYFFPFWAVDGLDNTIYINFFDVKTKDFKNTEIGVGAFEHKALICMVGRIPFSDLAPFFEPNDTGILKLSFETSAGKILKGEETFYFK
jgi:hypothetical protein